MQTNRTFNRWRRERITIITGSRSLEGIKFITDRFHIDRPRIMYITAPFEQLKSNYERREKT